jgi:formate hydrogenlyase subunit 3/multisubunit Na+/H+ antiporter MnhD subunit
VTLLLIALLILLVGAILSAVLSPSPNLASLIGSTLAAVGSLLGFVTSLINLSSGLRVEAIHVPWALPNAAISFGIDPLSTFFLLPLFLLGAITAFYGHHYLHTNQRRLRRGLSWVFFNLLLFSMACLLIARHAVLFLVAWEVMSLTAYLLFTYEHEDQEVRSAGMIYLVAAHIGVACLLGLFLLLGKHAHGFEFNEIAGMPRITDSIALGLFALGVFGFGVKAGLFPMHVWLPQAHAAAPSHISALMSGVLIKMGIYGLLRIVELLGGPRPYWGPILLGLGVTSAVYAISMAVYQRDYKRVLAYSSIENMGIIALGIGLGFWGQARGYPLVATLGMSGALLHVLHHSVTKGLLFLVAGNVLHACHTKDLERLGGLGKRMSLTFAMLTLGAVAIAGLPPLNAFVSEWLLYRGLMEGALVGRGAGAVACVFAVALLSLIGAFTVLTFVRLVSVSMLGEPRSKEAAKAHDASWVMCLPLVPLALIILVQAVWADRVLAWLKPVLVQLLGTSVPTNFQGFELNSLVYVNLVLIVVLMGLGIFVVRMFRKSTVGAVGPTWDCGFVAPTARIQYTARGISELFTETLLPKPLGPKVCISFPSGPLPRKSELLTNNHDPLTRAVYEPFFSRWANRFARLRWVQQGHLHIYLLYILMTLVIALTFSILYRGTLAP